MPRTPKQPKFKTASLPVALESEKQTALFEWAALAKGKYPELDLLYHVPNGGSRNKIEAGRLQAQGVKAGVPDLCLPVPRGEYHSLYIELKRIKGGSASAEQEQWIDFLRGQGYAAEICKGWMQAKELIEGYLDITAK
jgi:hypothetical protein